MRGKRIKKKLLIEGIGGWRRKIKKEKNSKMSE